MSYKSSQLPPPSTRGANFRIAFQNSWSSTPIDYCEQEVFRSWFIFDPELDEARPVNQDVMLGMALVLGVSASFWVGAGFAIAQLLK